MAEADYLSIDDYKYHIRTYRLDQILEKVDEDEEAILDAAEVEALAMISYYLSNYYDMGIEFAKSGDARNKIVMRWAKVLVIYFIYERIPDDMTPERVVKNYNDVLKQLEVVDGAEKNVPGLTPITVTDSDGNTEPQTRRRWGSRARRSNDGSSDIIRGKY